MAKASTTKLITERKEGDSTFYDFRCPHPTGCGVNAADPDADPFSSVGWLDREHAVARGKQHIAEHDNPGEPMPELHEFRVGLGITADTAGAKVRPEDWEF
jgi:hypothetical protein